MAIESDDSDIRLAWLQTMLGGNGDYYINVIEVRGGLKTVNTTRISTSGGNAPTRVKIAVAELYRAMEEAGLNDYPL